jgi:hypothetical protein
MRNKILLGTILAGLLATGFAFVRPTTALAADMPKNVKVLKGLTKPEIKKYMKELAKSLGVQCDHCHDTDDMSKDTPKKERAREMMTMVNDINTAHFKGEKKPRVSCMTCHNGSIKPK